MNQHYALTRVLSWFEANHGKVGLRTIGYDTPEGIVWIVRFSHCTAAQLEEIKQSCLVFPPQTDPTATVGHEIATIYPALGILPMDHPYTAAMKIHNYTRMGTFHPDNNMHNPR